MTQIAGIDEVSAQLADRNAQVQEYLNRFSRALVAGDGRTIAGMWGIPSLVLGADTALSVQSQDQVEAFFGGAMDQYNKAGIVATHPDITSLRWLTDRLVVVTVRWPYLDANGEEVGAESSTYTLRRDERGEFKLFVAVMHGVESR
jgi:hypothetical protein